MLHSEEYSSILRRRVHFLHLHAFPLGPSKSQRSSASLSISVSFDPSNLINTALGLFLLPQNESWGSWNSARHSIHPKLQITLSLPALRYVNSGINIFKDPSSSSSDREVIPIHGLGWTFSKKALLVLESSFIERPQTMRRSHHVVDMAFTIRVRVWGTPASEGE
ncbi:hypothetical protein CEXT_225691 [Caerostris extrusa]|uniref:Uncharacterized protein n=1 Tax=Caerostris extrusa TaxID=172846 RepID=A0AAV4Y9E6_CAEEX|nr:hypothetical protein CEXT_225691 [Caerostris extrusa]